VYRAFGRAYSGFDKGERVADKALYYVVLDARREQSAIGWIGPSRLVALQFPSQEAREVWLTQVLQSARAKNAWRLGKGGGSGGSGSPLQPALPLPTRIKKKLDA